MLSLKIIDGKHHIVRTDRYKTKVHIKANIEGVDQNFELKINDRINPIATPILVLYSSGVPLKRFLPFNENDITRYQIIKILIEQFGIQKYFPKIEIGYIYLQYTIVKGVFEDLVLFGHKSLGLSHLAQQYSGCVPLNVVPKPRLVSDVFDHIDSYEWQMFMLMIPLMGLWDIALHNVLLKAINGVRNEYRDFHFVHIDFGDVPMAWTGKKRTLIVNPKLLEYFNKKFKKIHPDVIRFINNLDVAGAIQKVNETHKMVPAQKVWKKLWDEGRRIEMVVKKMKEQVNSEESFGKLFTVSLFE